MTVIVQRNRILIDGFDEDKAKWFVKNHTVFNKKMTFGVEELWTAIFQNAVYKGKTYWAVARNTPQTEIMRFLEGDARDVVRDTDYHIQPKPSKISLKKDVKPRDELQVRLLDFLHGRESYSDLEGKPRRALFVDTGEGKTFLTISYIAEYGKITAIFCPDERAIKTWEDEFFKFTTIEKNQIGYLRGQNSIPKILKNKDRVKVLFCSEKTISAIFREGNEKALLELFEELGVGLKVIDEMHLNLSAVFFSEMLLVTEKTFYLTATDSRRIPHEQTILERMTPPLDCVYRQDKVEKFDYVEVQYFSNPAKEHTKGINKPNGFDALTYLKMLLNEEWNYREFFLNKVLRPSVNYALKKVKKGQKIAILTKTNDSGDIIADWAAKEYPQLTIGRFNSRIAKMEDRMKETEKDIIISTDKSFAGITNILNLAVEINVTPVTSEAHLLQIAGRMRREGDKRRIFIQLYDFSFKKARSMAYRERKIIRPVSLSENVFVVGKPRRQDEDEEE